MSRGGTVPPASGDHHERAARTDQQLPKQQRHAQDSVRDRRVDGDDATDGDCLAQVHHRFRAEATGVSEERLCREEAILGYGRDIQVENALRSRLARLL